MPDTQMANVTHELYSLPPKSKIDRASELTITPTGYPVGAVVTGLDASRPLSPSTLFALKRAWAEHLVLIFKDQLLSDPQYIDFATYFGNIFYPPADVPVEQQ
jgi:taurine dioxygenase